MSLLCGYFNVVIYIFMDKNSEICVIALNGAVLYCATKILIACSIHSIVASINCNNTF